MKIKQSLPLKIGVIGAGFSGAALAANIHRLSQTPVEITLFEKTGQFGLGDAYRTPYQFHLLNVRARDMSAFEDEPSHFVNWLNQTQPSHPQLNSNLSFADQFAPRHAYGQYIKSLISHVRTDIHSKIKLNLQSAEVTDVIAEKNAAILQLKDQGKIKVDKVVLALGNNPAASFPFPVSKDINCIHNPWDYTAIEHIDKKAPILIVGTGLSMIDAVLTLYHQAHEGPIYALSRHGLLPLPHSETGVSVILMQEQLPESLRSLTRHLRLTSEYYINEGGHWQSVVNALRLQFPQIWDRASLLDKKRFLRHVLSYWNIHRHRVHTQIIHKLDELKARQQLQIYGGKVIKVEKDKAHIQLRHSQALLQLEINWLVNCMGPSLRMTDTQQPLLQSLFKNGLAMPDPLNLGLNMLPTGALKESSGKPSSLLYAIGPLRKGISWECGAVPEIRKQCFDLAKHLLNSH